MGFADACIITVKIMKTTIRKTIFTENNGNLPVFSAATPGKKPQKPVLPFPFFAIKYFVVIARMNSFKELYAYTAGLVKKMIDHNDTSTSNRTSLNKKQAINTD